MTITRRALAAYGAFAAFAFTATKSHSETGKDTTMKYMLLIHGNEGQGPQYGTKEFEAYMGEYFAATERYKKDGVFVGGEALQPVATATTLRVRNGKNQTMDGPFMETKEQLGGFYILDCKNLDEAIKYAAMIPDARIGGVEIRPVMVFD
jgi:hypothetical protein